MDENTLPLHAVDLVRELMALYPHRCLRVGQSAEDAHRYAGAVELVERLAIRLDYTENRDRGDASVREDA